MSKRISASQAKAQLSSFLAEVAYGGQPIVIERHGKPCAALVSMDDLRQIEHYRTTSSRPQGALAIPSYGVIAPLQHRMTELTKPLSLL